MNIQNFYNLTNELQQVAEELGLVNAGFDDVVEVQEPCDEADDVTAGFDSVYEGRN